MNTIYTLFPLRHIILQVWIYWRGKKLVKYSLSSKYLSQLKCATNTPFFFINLKSYYKSSPQKAQLLVLSYLHIPINNHSIACFIIINHSSISFHVLGLAATRGILYTVWTVQMWALVFRWFLFDNKTLP